MRYHLPWHARLFTALLGLSTALLTGCGADGVTTEEKLEFQVTLENGDVSGGASIDLYTAFEPINCNLNCTVAPGGSRQSFISHGSPGMFTFTATRGGTTLATVECEAVDGSNKQVIWYPESKGSNAGTLLCGTGWVGGGICPKILENNSAGASMLGDCGKPEFKLETVTGLSADWTNVDYTGTTAITLSLPEIIHPGDVITVSATYSASVTYLGVLVGTETLHFGIGGAGLEANTVKVIGTSTLANRTVAGSATVNGTWTVPTTPLFTNDPQFQLRVTGGFQTHSWGTTKDLVWRKVK